MLGTNRGIVVAEDDKATREMLAAALSTELGARVVLVPDGERAVEVVRRQRPAVVVLDMIMPGIDGLEAARQLKADPVTADIPIVAISAAPRRAEALAAGCDRFLAKPLQLDELLDLVHSLAGHRAR
jgi:CheY-like chemotaxis protein